jgi:hypothetical protein
MGLVFCCAVGWAHRTSHQFATGAIVVAHLDGLAETTFIGPIQGSWRWQRRRVIWPKTQQRSIIKFQRFDDLSGVQLVLGIKGGFNLLKRSGQACAEQGFNEF